MDTAWQMPVWEVFATEKGRPVEREDAGEAGLRGSALSANRWHPVECGVGCPGNTHVVPVRQLTRI